MIKKYVKKPIPIEAIKYDGENRKEVVAFIDGVTEIGEDFLDPTFISIKTLEGEMKVSVGDYVIKGIKGEFYPCKPDIFEESYLELKDD